MESYIITLIGVSILSGFIEILAPESAGEQIKKHVKLVSSLCVLCIALAPLVSFIKEIGETDVEGFWEYSERAELEEKYDEIFNESLGSYTADSIARGSETMLAEQFGISVEDIDIIVSVSDVEGVLSVDGAKAVLYGNAVTHNPREISGYIESLLGCKCEIIYG